MTTASESEHEPEPPVDVDRPSTPPLAADITPPNAHEMRCGSLENKEQTEKEATLQLQANMILTCATLLENRLMSLTSTKELPPLDSLVCYGVLHGPT